MHWAMIEQLGTGKAGLQLDNVRAPRVGFVLLLEVIPQLGNTVEHGCPMCAADIADS